MHSSDQLLGLLTRSPFGGGGQIMAARVAPLFVSRRLGRGQVVFLEGDVDGRFYLVGEGRLKAFRSAPGGRSITLFVLAAGDYFGFIPLLDGGPFPLSVSALSESVVYSLSRPDFLCALRSDPELSVSLLGYLAHRFRGCCDRVGQLGRQGAVTRLAHALLGLLPAGDGPWGSIEVVLPFSQVELAHTLDITPPNLSRAFARLRQEKLIARVGPRRFRISNVTALRRMTEAE